MRTELTRFRVIDGKSDIVDEWMAFLRDNTPCRHDDGGCHDPGADCRADAGMIQ